MQNEFVVDVLVNHSLRELWVHFEEIQLVTTVPWWEGEFSIWIYKSETDDEEYSVSISLDIHIREWAKPWSITAFTDVITQLMAETEISNASCMPPSDDDEPVILFGLEYFTDNIDSTLKQLQDAATLLLKAIVEKTNQRLLANLDKDTITEFFQFPKEYKAACKQYLVYFAQFIADLGITVSTEIKDEANQTLFRVIPQDKTEGLEKIREALDVYLAIPGAKEFQTQAALNQDIAVVQLKYNISHLEGQIELAKGMLQLKDATIQAKDATIDALQLSNYQLSRIAASKETKKETGEEEAIIEGIVSVKKYDQYGVVVNLPQIVKKLKRRFGKK